MDIDLLKYPLCIYMHDTCGVYMYIKGQYLGTVGNDGIVLHAQYKYWIYLV